MEILLAIFLILGILYFIKKLAEPSIREAPRAIIEIKFPDIPYAAQQPDQQSDEDKFWDGPAPTVEQRRVELNKLVNFFMQFPESALKESYPKEANMAVALKRYRELELLLQVGDITQEAYNEEVEKILPLIDISEDLPPAEK